MGHSFGCITVSSAVGGAVDAPPLPRPIDSLFLVQGALSLWSFAAEIPYAKGKAGYFNRIIADRRVSGPIITTRSAYDTAIGRDYPLGAYLKKQLLLDQRFPAYGGIGAFGVRGLPVAPDMPIQSVGFQYDFRGARIYNLEASRVIRNGSGASGAHNDIAHPEVTHAFWAAVLCAMAPRSGGLLSPSQQRQQQQPQWPQQQQQHHAAAAAATAAAATATTATTAAAAATAAAAQQQQPSESAATAHRWINAEIEDHARDEALQLGQWYALAFDVDVAPHDSAVASTLFVDTSLFPLGTDEVVLTVQLDSQDFLLSDETRPLRVPRVGRSFTKARFDILPLHNGPATIKATVHKEGNFIQQMELTFDVGARQATRVRVTALGRPPAAVNLVHPRDIGLQISPLTGGYDCVVWGAVSARARLPLLPGYLASAVDAARRELLNVIMHQDEGGNYDFQTSVDILSPAGEFALRTMARAGARLFQQIFFGPAAGADSQAIGTFLRTAASDRTRRLKLQIVAESAPVPWGLLYMGDASTGAQLDWDNFLGMRHVIEQIPLQNTLAISDCAIPSDKPDLSVSVNLNRGIDQQLGGDYVAQQESFWATQRRRANASVLLHAPRSQSWCKRWRAMRPKIRSCISTVMPKRVG